MMRSKAFRVGKPACFSRVRKVLDDQEIREDARLLADKSGIVIARLVWTFAVGWRLADAAKNVAGGVAGVKVRRALRSEPASRLVFVTVGNEPAAGLRFDDASKESTRIDVTQPCCSGDGGIEPELLGRVGSDYGFSAGVREQGGAALWLSHVVRSDAVPIRFSRWSRI